MHTVLMKTHESLPSQQSTLTYTKKRKHAPSKHTHPLHVDGYRMIIVVVDETISVAAMKENTIIPQLKAPTPKKRLRARLRKEQTIWMAWVRQKLDWRHSSEDT